MTPYGYVYKITNKITGKSYVGSRKLSRDTSWRQYLGSGKLIKQAISKYGASNFTKEFIQYGFTQEELFNIERYVILKEKLSGGAEYNLAIYTPNTDNFNSVSDEVRRLWRINLSSGVKKSYDSRYSPATILFNKKLEEFRSKFDDDSVVESYRILKNYTEVAKQFKTSRKVVYTILTENNSKPSRQAKSEDTKDRISIALSGSPRNLCSCGKKLSKRSVSCFDCKYKISDEESSTVVSLKSSGKSVREISRITGLSRTRVSRILNIYT